MEFSSLVLQHFLHTYCTHETNMLLNPHLRCWALLRNKCSLHIHCALHLFVFNIQPYLFCESPDENNHWIIYTGRDMLSTLNPIVYVVSTASNSLGPAFYPSGMPLVISCQLDLVLLINTPRAHQSSHLLSTYPTQISPIWQKEHCRKLCQRPC